jgi:thiol-disulfide isomerase/thioredoxin
MSIDRRTLVAALAAAPSLAFAQTEPATERAPTFTEGPLARNPIAMRFRRVPASMPWPPPPLLDAGGRHPLDAFKGKAVLLSLWSENCAPCLLELPIFSAFNAKYGGDALAIVPVGTGPSRLSASAARAQQFLNDRKVSLHTLIDGSPGGNAMMTTLAASRREPGGSLPCNLLIDAEGRLRGRQTGYSVTFPLGQPLPKTAEDMSKLKSVWETPDADAFFKALAAGALG